MRKWTVSDVMTKAVVSVPPDAPYRAVVDVLMTKRVSAVPVVDDFQRVLGVVSEADLLRKIEYAGDEEPRMFEGRHRRADRTKAKGRRASDLMTSPAVTAQEQTTIAAAARLMDGEHVKRLPVLDDAGRLVGIVTRGDLLKVHLRPDDEIQADARDGIDRDLLSVDAKGVEVTVTDGVVTLTGKVERWSTTELADRVARQTLGVVAVVNRLDYTFDDRAIVGPGVITGVA
ncbi:CBS domain-containing protein [Actinoplanes sp. NPDC049265]|uniref:CBS domain-containing protein n=1 Tax=Actinoplanes sp. NPDC049265 TaxID=3363902 RepID=UPI00371E123C